MQYKELDIKSIPSNVSEDRKNTNSDTRRCRYTLKEYYGFQFHLANKLFKLDINS